MATIFPKHIHPDLTIGHRWHSYRLDVSDVQRSSRKCYISYGPGVPNWIIFIVRISVMFCIRDMSTLHTNMYSFIWYGITHTTDSWLQVIPPAPWVSITCHEQHLCLNLIFVPEVKSFCVTPFHYNARHFLLGIFCDLRILTSWVNIRHGHGNLFRHEGKGPSLGDPW